MIRSKEELTVHQQRELCEICWKFEEAWADGEQISPEDCLVDLQDIAPEIVLEELSTIKQELEQKAALKQKQTWIYDQRYEFIEEIARGGAAVVWRVRDRHLQRETAVKHLLDSRDNREMRLRLEREARLCARLVHPGIVPIHELSSFADGRPFVSMKLVEGRTLQQLLEAVPPVDVKTVIDIFAKVCQAMAFAHSRGAIHRDLKPSNIMVGEFGEVQIMDWGLGKDLTNATPCTPSDPDSLTESTDDQHDFVDRSQRAENAQARDALETKYDSLGECAQSELTIVGSVFGTLSYMSPEQAQGNIDRSDRRSDVFSLGAILCRILTGLPPYHDADQSQLLRKAQEGDLQEALNRLRLSRRRRLADLASACLSLDPNRRPRDAQVVLEHLEIAKKADSRRRVYFTLAAIATAIALLAVPARMFAKPVTRQAPPTTSENVPAVVESSFDAETFKSLLVAKQYRVALKSYRRVLNENPSDSNLYREVCIALLNTARFTEAEPIIRELMALDDRLSEPHYMLSESLFGQGKLEECQAELLTCRALQGPGESNPTLIEEKLARVCNAMQLLQQLSSADRLDYSAFSIAELQNLARVYEIIGKIEAAIQIHLECIEQEPDVVLRSILRHSILTSFVEKNLFQAELEPSVLDELCKVGIELLREQFEFASVETQAPDASESAKQRGHVLMNVLQDVSDKIQLPNLRLVTTDSRISPQLRSELADLFREIDAFQIRR